MALNLGELYAKIKLDTSEASKALNDFKGSTKEVGESLQDTGKKLMKAGALGTTAIAGLAIAGGEWQARVEGTAFMYKQLDPIIQKNIDTHSKEAEALGLTSQQYKDSATELATYFKAMKVGAKETDKFLNSTVELIADLGAIKDVPFDEAMRDFKSALVGNHEAVDKYGLTLSASMMNESKYAKSIGKTTDKMTEQEKMYARLDVLYDQGAFAQGLARQEAEQFSMSLKLLTTKMGELVGKIGNALLPALTPLINNIEKIVDKITPWIEANQELIGNVLLAVGALSLFTFGVGLVLWTLGSLILVVGAVAGALALVLPHLTEIGLAFGFLVMMSDDLTAKFKETFDTLTDKITEASQVFYDKSDEMGLASGEWVMGIIQGIFDQLPNLITMFDSVVNFLLKMIFEAVPNFILGAGKWMLGFAQGILEGIPGVMDSLGNFFSMVGVYLEEKIPEWILYGLNQMTAMIKGWGDGAPQFWEKVTSTIESAILKIVEKLPEFITKGGMMVINIVKGIVMNAPQIAMAIVTLINTAIVALAKGLVMFIVKGSEMVFNIIIGIAQAGGELYNKMENLAKDAAEAFDKATRGFFEAGTNAVNKLLDGIKGAWGKVTGWISGAMSKLPFIGGKMAIRPEIDNPNIAPLTAGVNLAPMKRDIFSDLSLLGAIPKPDYSKLKVNKPTDKTSEAIMALTEAVNKSKEIFVESVVNLDGKEVARGTASYMQEELEVRNRRMNRLGGVL